MNNEGAIKVHIFNMGYFWKFTRFDIDFEQKEIGWPMVRLKNHPEEPNI